MERRFSLCMPHHRSHSIHCGREIEVPGSFQDELLSDPFGLGEARAKALDWGLLNFCFARMGGVLIVKGV